MCAAAQTIHRHAKLDSRAAFRRRQTDEIGGDVKPHPGRRMTEEEFVEWCDGKTRAEWVDGEVIIIEPDNIDHDWIQGGVKSAMLGVSEAQDAGAVCGGSFFVRLPGQRRRRLPDILFVSKARLHLLKQTVCDGAPDLVVEIVWPESTARDVREKYFEYQKAGVKEYWILNPNAKTIEVHGLGSDGKYAPVADVKGKLSSKVLKGFFLRREWMQQPKFPSMLTLLKEMKLVK